MAGGALRQVPGASPQVGFAVAAGGVIHCEGMTGHPAAWAPSPLGQNALCADVGHRKIGLS